MGAVSASIANLFNGVSQQAASLRAPTQGELMENCYPTIALGLAKRPPCEHVAKIMNGIVGEVFIGTTNRDTSERYCIVISNGSIRVFDLFTGTEKTVTTPEGSSYLTATNPRQAFGMVSVADYSFIVNRTVKVEMLETRSAPSEPGQTITGINRKAAVACVKAEYDNVRTYQQATQTYNPFSGQYITTYKDVTTGTNRIRVTTSVAHTLSVGMDVTMRGYGNNAFNRKVTIVAIPSATTFEYVPHTSAGLPASNTAAMATIPTSGLAYTCNVFILTTGAAHGLASGAVIELLGAAPTAFNGYYTVTVIPSTTTLTFNSLAAEDAATTLGTYTAVKAIKGTKQKYSDLPTSGSVDGDLWQIQGDPATTYDNYFVRWDAAKGVWIETADPVAKTTLNKLTMPHQLVREADGTFTFAPAEWDLRLVGDDKSNPIPSFVGSTITDILFYRNRLGFLSDESLILSRTGNYFNFWGETVTAVLDSDPIDVTASHTKVAILNWAVTFNKALLLFSGQNQFQLSSGDVLSPKTVKLEPVTEFESSNVARPVTAGQNVFFALDKGGFSAIREYFVDTDSFTNDASDITAHVPKYLPGGIIKLTSSSSEDVVMALSKDAPNEVFVYKYYWGPEEKVQSAWGKFILRDSDTLLNIELISTTLTLVIQRPDGVYLEKLELQPGVIDQGMGYLVHLDRKVKVQGTYNPTTDKTSWTLPYPPEAGLKAVLGPAFGSSSGGSFEPTTAGGNVVERLGDYSQGYVFMGYNYTKRYRFSEQFTRDQNSTSVISGRLQLLRASVRFNDTGYLRAEVAPAGRPVGRYEYTGQTLGDLGFIIGQKQIGSGKLSFPVLSKSSAVTIELINDTQYPSFCQSAEWEGVYSQKTR